MLRAQALRRAGERMSAMVSAVALIALSPVAGRAAPTGVQLREGPEEVTMARHEGRTFALAHEADMERFAKEDAADPRTGGIVFTGSSSIVGWTSLALDMAPLPVANRGFGGSTSLQLWWYADRAVLARRPRVVVVYVGDNDLFQANVTVGNYLKYIRLLRDETWQVLPRTRLVFVSIKPSPLCWQWWPKFQEANRRLESMCSRDPRLSYVDIASTLLNEQGQVRPECFVEDMVHIRPEVYAEWTKVVRPTVEAAWREALAEG
jgi:hypothetical protein